MRLAVIGSRRLYVRDLSPYLPDNVTEIVSGGAKGIDGCAGEYARRNGIPLTEFLPDYRRYGKGAGGHRRPGLALPRRPANADRRGDGAGAGRLTRQGGPFPSEKVRKPPEQPVLIDLLLRGSSFHLGRETAES